MAMAQKKSIKLKRRWWQRPLSLRLFWPFFVFLTLLFILSLFNLWSLFQVRKEISADLSAIKEELIYYPSPATTYYTDRHLELSAGTGDLATITPVSVTAAEILTVANSFIPAAQEQLLSGRLNSFGDNFSGLAYINQGETDMFWDESVTAFTLPPIYSLKQQSECAEPDCGLSRATIDPISVCLTAGCLQKTGDLRLLFNNRELKLPPPVSGETLSSITLFALGNRWLIGLVSGPSTEERGWVYAFDGLAFSPLITDDSAYQIKPRFQRGGGRIAFGGSEDDFIILYAGYDGKAFRVRTGAIEDISKFFGLRVTDGGFMPQIFKLGSGQDSIFYVCSVTANKPKLIKIWSKDALNSAGVLDLSVSIFKDKLRSDSILCAVSDVGKKQLAIASSYNNAYSLWSFQDQGFDHGRSRQVTSINLNLKDKEQVKAAVLADFGVETLSGCPGAGAKVYLANQADVFTEVNPYLWHGFSEQGAELYWRVTFYPEGDNYDSPWLDHVNRLDYLFAD